MDQRTTLEYDKWLSSLRNEDVLEITAQVEDLIADERLLATGLPKSSPHIRSLGGRVSEVKTDGRGAGYRAYFTTFGGTLVLLCGGRKDSQTEDVNVQNASPNEFTPEVGAAIRQAHGDAVANAAAERPALRRKLRERAEEYRAGGLADKAAYFEGIADAADKIAQQRPAGGTTAATHPMAAAGSTR